MKNKTDLKKVLPRIGFFYGIIICLVNYFGFLIPTEIGKMPIFETEEFKNWSLFMNHHSGIIKVMSVMCFVIPTLICLAYIIIYRAEDLKKRIINIPLAFSITGSLGWFLSFFTELIFLLIFHSQTGYSIKSITISSLLNITQVGLFIFTFVFLILDSIHRNFILPKFFPEGKISETKGVIKLSSKFLFTVFYLSVSIFPIFYITSTLLIIQKNYNLPVEKGVLAVILIIIFFGIISVINLCHYYSTPLKKLTKATNEIKTAHYEERVNIVSSDELGDLADNFNDMAYALSEKTKKILSIQNSIIKGMAVMVESRDNSTGGHINRTSDCVKVFINQLKKTEKYKNLSDSFCASIIKAAPMHDLGKIAVDDAILRKPGRFTDEEYEKMKTHAAEGAKIVENVLYEVDDEEFKRITINVAHYHHEKWDGTGYPEKISKENIPLEARIMALADVFDALVSKRCYKESMSYDKAFEIIQDSLGTHFDPDLGKCFLESRNIFEELYNRY